MAVGLSGSSPVATGPLGDFLYVHQVPETVSIHRKEEVDQI